jgi:RHS repeat-associated protein
MKTNTSKNLRFHLILLAVFALILPCTARGAIRDMSPDITAFSVTSASGTSQYTGDLHLAIPIMKVPGRNGLDFDLNLNYRSGIKMEDEASWVGLGFSFGGGAIIQEVHRIPDDHDPKGWLKNGSEDQREQDFWGISFGGQFRRIVWDDTKTPHIENWQPWKIEYVRDTVQQDHRIQYFKVTKEDGTVYIYGSRLGDLDSPEKNGWHSSFTQQDEKIPESDTPYCATRPCKQFYTNFWELTEIQSPDYVDANGNNIADDPDRGSWVRLRYSDYTNASECYVGNEWGCRYYYPPNQSWEKSVEDPVTRVWKSGQYPSALNNAANWILTGKTKITKDGKTYWFNNYITRKTEIDFFLLHEIETPTHLATVVVSDRQDLKSEKMVTSRAKKVERVELKRKGNAAVIKKTNFVYDSTYPLCKNAPNSQGTTNNGRLTLRSLTICGSTTCLKPYEFEYANNDAPGTGNNPIYKQFAVDDWGYPNGKITNTDYYDNTGGKHDANALAQAWSLTKLKNPNGGSTEYLYEPDTYSYENATAVAAATGGGIRITKTTESSGLATQIKRYQYLDGTVIKRPRRTTVNDGDWVINSFAAHGFLGGIMVSEVTYSTVKEMAGASGTPYGWIETDFATSQDYPDTEDPDEQGYPQTSAGWKRGQITQTRMYTASGTPVSTKTYTYTVQPGNFFRYTDNVGQNTFHIDSGWITPYQTITTQDDASKTVTYGEYSADNGIAQKIIEETGSKKKITAKYFCQGFANCTNMESGNVGQVINARHILNLPFTSWVKEDDPDSPKLVSYSYNLIKVETDGLTDHSKMRIYPKATLSWVDFDGDREPDWSNSPNGSDGYYGEMNLTFDSWGNVLTKQDLRGIVTTFTYDPSRANSLLLSSTKNGQTTSYVYGDTRFNRETAINYPDGTSETKTYDDLERVATSLSKTGAQTSMTYNFATGTLTNTNLNWERRQTSVNGTTRTHTTYADGLGREIMESDYTGSQYIITYKKYDDIGREYISSVPYTSTSVDYGIASPYGYSLKTYYPDPMSRTFEYYPNYFKDNALKYSSAYDNDGVSFIKTTITDPGGATANHYSHILGLSDKTQQQANLTVIDKDMLGNPTILTDASSKITKFFFDQRGKKVGTKRPDMTSFNAISHPELGQVTEEWVYESGGSPTLFRDSNLAYATNTTGALEPKHVAISYDNFGREILRKVVTDLGSVEQSGTSIKKFWDTYPVNEPGYPAAWTQPVRTDLTNWATRALGKATYIDHPVQKEVLFYDNAGFLAEHHMMIDNVDYRFEYYYNQAGEVEKRTIDPLSNIKVQHYYNVLGQLRYVDLIKSDNTTIRVADLTYTPEGKVNTLSRTANGVTTTYGYDDLRRMNLIQTTGLTNSPLGFNRFYEFDDLGRISYIHSGTTPSSKIIGDFSGYYDSFGRLMGGTVESLITGDRNLLSFSYDNVGNRTYYSNYDLNRSTMKFEDTYGYYAGTNRLNGVLHNLSGTISGDSYTYDYNGNIKRKINTLGLNNMTYNYNHYGQLQSLVVGNSSTDYYYYNNDSKRVKKTDRYGINYYYLYDGDNIVFDRKIQQVLIGDVDVAVTSATKVDPGSQAQASSALSSLDVVTILDYVTGGKSVPSSKVAADYNQDSEVSINDVVSMAETLYSSSPWPPPKPRYRTVVTNTAYVDVEGIRLLSIENANTAGPKYYLADHLGSSSVITDSTGKEIGREEYYPFGETLASSGGTERYKFTGKEKDYSTGLYNFGARYYCPEIGRFPARDTVDDGVNPYAYVHNNPLIATDPTGHGDDYTNFDWDYDYSYSSSWDYSYSYSYYSYYSFTAPDVSRVWIDKNLYFYSWNTDFYKYLNRPSQATIGASHDFTPYQPIVNKSTPFEMEMTGRFYGLHGETVSTFDPISTGLGIVAGYKAAPYIASYGIKAAPYISGAAQTAYGWGRYYFYYWLYYQVPHKTMQAGTGSLEWQTSLSQAQINWERGRYGKAALDIVGYYVDPIGIPMQGYEAFQNFNELMQGLNTGPMQYSPVNSVRNFGQPGDSTIDRNGQMVYY